MIRYWGGPYEGSDDEANDRIAAKEREKKEMTASQETVSLDQTRWADLNRTQSYTVTNVNRFGKKVLAVIVKGDDGSQYWIRCNRIDGTVPEEFCNKGAVIPALPQ